MKADKKVTGLVQVYTGNGKGKTTACFGLALRASGHGKKVIIIQFMKGDPNYGEVKAVKNLPNIELIQSGLPTFVKKGDPSPEDLELAEKGLDIAVNAVKSGEYDLVILDEINVAVDFGLISLKSVLEIIENKNEKTELILSGRYAAKELTEIADLVSEVKEIKHPFTKGIPARKGIDF